MARCLAAVISAILTGCGTVESPPEIEPRLALRNEAFQRYASGDLPAARRLFQDGLDQAGRVRDARDLSRFHAGLGLCDMADGHYSRALGQFQTARRWAAQASGFAQAADLYASAAANVASAYGRMGDFENSKRALRDGLAARPSPRQDALLRLNLAICHTEEGPPREAEELLGDLIGRVRASGDTAMLGRALERLGYHLTKTGRLAEAEAPLLESIRVREAGGNPERFDPHFVLAQLRLAQGRPPEALAHLERYARSGRRHYSSGRVYDMRGQILEAMGQPEPALGQYREAVAAMRRRRSHIRPSEHLLRVSELALPELYENFIRLASLLHRRTGRRTLLAEAMAASEEIRVAFQREAYYPAERWAEQNEAYRALLGRLDALEAAGVKTTDPRVDRLQLELASYESSMAEAEPLLIPPPADPVRHLPHLQAATAPDEAVFVFHVTRSTSLAWMVTREGVASAQLPPANELAPLITCFAKELKANGESSHPAGEELFTKILGDFSAAAGTKLHWTLVLDGPLFELPWPALPLPVTAEDRRLGRRALVVDRHALSLLPSFFPVPAAGPGATEARPVSPLFAAVGDPIYNAADPRGGQTGAEPASELARLPGSAEEVRRAAEIWRRAGYTAQVLVGNQATARQLLQVVSRRPAVLHLATHVVSGPGSAGGEARLALSLQQGRPELLGARELSQWRLPGAMVMMAGCASGRGTPQPAGLVGLTRAWLLSGAEGVVASLWPVPDDQGEFVSSFYLRVSENKNKNQFNGSHRLAWARALREATLQARGSGHLPATTWAAYYLMGRN